MLFRKFAIQICFLVELISFKFLNTLISDLCGLCCVTPQVRCMMAVLLLIGQKLETPEIINQLLDVQSNPRKPQYR